MPRDSLVCCLGLPAVAEVKVCVLLRSKYIRSCTNRVCTAAVSAVGTWSAETTTSVNDASIQHGIT